MKTHQRTNRPVHAVPEIKPNGVYDRAWIIANLRVSKETIAAAEEAGELVRAPLGNGHRYLGVWLLRWLHVRSKLPRRQGEQQQCESEAA